MIQIHREALCTQSSAILSAHRIIPSKLSLRKLHSPRRVNHATAKKPKLKDTTIAPAEIKRALHPSTLAAPTAAPVDCTTPASRRVVATTGVVVVISRPAEVTTTWLTATEVGEAVPPAWREAAAVPCPPMTGDWVTSGDETTWEG